MLQRSPRVRGDGAGDSRNTPFQLQFPPEKFLDSALHLQIPPPQTHPLHPQCRDLAEKKVSEAYPPSEAQRRIDRRRSQTAGDGAQLQNCVGVSRPVQRKKADYGANEDLEADPCIKKTKEEVPAQSQAVILEDAPRKLLRSGPRPSPATAPMSAAVLRHTKVRFAAVPSVATFHIQLPPCVTGCNRACSRPMDIVMYSRPKSIMKKQPRETKYQESNPPQVSSLCVFESSLHPSTQLDSSLGRNFQGEPAQQQWQLVRRKQWWRKERNERKAGIYSQQPATWSVGRQIFLEKTRGRCFNCLTKGHRAAQCRDPTKCWKCKSNGHISSRCTNKASVRSHLPRQHRLQSTLDSFASCCFANNASCSHHNSHSSRQAVAAPMERRLSFGSAGSRRHEHRTDRLR